MRRMAIVTGVAGLVGILLVGACSSSGKHASTLSGGSAAPKAASAPNGSFDAAGGAAAGAPTATGESAAAPDSQRQAPLASTAQIVTAQLNVQVRDVAAQADKARQITTTAGGRVDGDDRSLGKDPSATLILKLPPDQLADAISKLSDLGKEQSRQQSTKDVTTEVADVNSRVESAQDSIDRLNALFASATKVGDIIVIERELAQREADLESLQAQQHALQSQTSMATVTLSLTTKVVTPPVKQHKHGFLGGLSRGWHNFTDGVGAVPTGVGVAVPFVVLIALLGAAALVLRRRWPRSRPAPVPGDAS
jgi:hypothetical protein